MAVAPRGDSRHMKQLRADFFAQGKALDADGDPAADCWRCQQRIDYQVAPNSTPDSHNLGHFKSYRDFPELLEDPTNFRHEHALCNQVAGADLPSLGLGVAVKDWW